MAKYDNKTVVARLQELYKDELEAIAGYKKFLTDMDETVGVRTKFWINRHIEDEERHAARLQEMIYIYNHFPNNR